MSHRHNRLTMLNHRIFPLLAIFMSISTFGGCDSNAPTLQSPAHDGVGFTPKVITLREVPDSSLKELTDDILVFIDKTGTAWVAPKGTRTDGASVPRLALWITDGRFAKEFLKAAVVHDAYCQSDNETRSPGQYRTKPWEAVHRMFYEAMIAGGTTPTKARLMFAAVWLGGPRWNDPVRNLDQVSDKELKIAFQACKEWIEENDPTIEEIEAWMEPLEQELLEHDN